MKRSALKVIIVLFPLLLFLAQEGRAANLGVILQDVSGGQGVGKADISGTHFEVKVARLTPITEFSVVVRGTFPEGSAVLGRFLTGRRGGARFRIEVTDIDLSLVKEVEVRLSDAAGGTLVMRGLVR